MPSSCCVVGCTNRKTTHPMLNFYAFPTTKKNLNKRNLWIKAIKREDFETEKQIDNARVCSSHFLSGLYIFSSHIYFFLYLLFLDFYPE